MFLVPADERARRVAMEDKDVASSSPRGREQSSEGQDRTERDGPRLLDVLERNSTLPVGVSTVQIIGARQTRKSFLKSVTKPLLTSEDEPLSAVVENANRVAAQLHAFNIFDPGKTSVTFDRARGALARKNDVDIVFRVGESPRFAAQTGTWAGDGEATAQVSARAANLFGGAERIEGVLEAGTRTRSAWEVKLQSPVLNRGDVLGEVKVFGTTRDHRFFASHELSQRGANATVKMLSNAGVHEVSVSSVLRQVTGLAPRASPSVVSAAGSTVKNSLSHSITRDRRDDMLLPTQGYLLKSLQEYAGVGGGDVHYVKATLESQYVHTFSSVWPRVHFICGLRAGVLRSLRRDRWSTHLTDRFYLGGPTDVRGFREFGLGPKDGTFAAYSAGIMFPVPNVPKTWPLRFQAFVNGGSLLPLYQGKLGSTVSELAKRPSIGIGCGLIYRTGLGRVELNFCLPVTMRQGDWPRKGFQFGIGVDFM